MSKTGIILVASDLPDGRRWVKAHPSLEIRCVVTPRNREAARGLTAGGVAITPRAALDHVFDNERMQESVLPALLAAEA